MLACRRASVFWIFGKEWEAVLTACFSVLASALWSPYSSSFMHSFSFWASLLLWLQMSVKYSSKKKKKSIIKNIISINYLLSQEGFCLLQCCCFLCLYFKQLNEWLEKEEVMLKTSFEGSIASLQQMKVWNIGQGNRSSQRSRGQTYVMLSGTESDFSSVPALSPCIGWHHLQRYLACRKNYA